MAKGVRLALASLWASLAGLAAFSATAGAPPITWRDLATLDTVQVVTQDEDGAPRVTTVWLAVYGGQGYIRTGHTKWGANVERDPNVRLLADGKEYSLAAHPIPTGATYDAINQVFRDKYGLTDQVMGLLRNLTGPAVIMRLDELPGIPMANPAADSGPLPELPTESPAPDANADTSDSAPAN